MSNGSEEKRRIAILGSTGSIGTQALEVIAAHQDKLEVEVLTAGSNTGLLIEQALRFQPNAVVIGDSTKYQQVRDALATTDVKVFAGSQAIEEVVEMESIDTVLTAMVGAAGLKPTVRAIQRGKQIALANKETLVVAGALITELARQNAVNLLPVDSEHSAIFQCLAGEWHNPIDKIILTASGGPFRWKSREDLAQVTREQALKHPNWTMGSKITIDSATLMNKGLEVLEAKWLFHLRPNQIEVIVHPQSIIHSIVQFHDGSMKAQMGLPDMKLPIQYALGYPTRLPSDFPRFDFMNYPNLSFEAPDRNAFRCLDIAYEAMRRGGNVACVMNAANEIAVAAFLQGRISFLEIATVIEKTISSVSFKDNPSIEDLYDTDAESRRIAESVCG
ncbi:MAG: 1-deoxy-D-xylulose-5-phosphate reductoisomerase [Flavobacteriales bacterium]